MTRAFQTVPHLSTSTGTARDVFLSPEEERGFLDAEVCVFEKLDGVNVVLHHGRDGVEVHLKTAWRDALDGRLLRGAQLWAALREAQLLRGIPRGGELVVEWLRYRLALRYAGLPDVALAIAARDPSGRALPYTKAHKWFERAGVATNPPIFRGKLGDVATLRRMVKGSRYGRGTMEGVVVEKTKPSQTMWCKWVRPDYHQPSAADLDARALNGLA